MSYQLPSSPVQVSQYYKDNKAIFGKIWCLHCKANHPQISTIDYDDLNMFSEFLRLGHFYLITCLKCANNEVYFCWKGEIDSSKYNLGLKKFSCYIQKEFITSKESSRTLPSNYCTGCDGHKIVKHGDTGRIYPCWICTEAPKPKIPWYRTEHFFHINSVVYK